MFEFDACVHLFINLMLNLTHTKLHCIFTLLLNNRKVHILVSVDIIL